MSDKKRLMLIDGHALAFRAYHAIPPLTSPSGEPTNAVFGFISMLLKAIEDLKPDYVIAAFDVGRTFRHEEYAEYKGTRAQTPDDLRAQFDRVLQMVRALAIPICTQPGYEADDVLGTLSAQASQQGLEAVIVTGDSDTFQLVADDVKVLTPRRTLGETALYDPAAVRERYGLEPAQLVDLKALVGDTSDNIPGVRGVGAKTATALLQQYGTLEAIYEHLDEVRPERYRVALEAGRESALMSKHLVTIVRDLPVELDLLHRWGDYDREQVMALLRELGFGTLADRIPRTAPVGPAAQLGLFDTAVEAVTGGEAPAVCALGEYCAVDTEEALDALVTRLEAGAGFAIDTETDQTDAMRAHLVGISLSDAAATGYYLPVGHDRRLNVGRQLDLDVVRRKLGPLLADPALPKTCHNAKFDLIVLARHGLPVSGLSFDTMLAAWLLEPSGRGIGLKNQAWQRLGAEMTPIEDVIGKGRNQTTMDLVAVSKAAPYACADADMTLRLAAVLRPELDVRNQWDLFADIEMPLVPVLMGMEMHGMRVDRAYLEAMSREMAQRLDALQADIWEGCGRTFNINSTKQLAEVLFDVLKLPVVRRTQTGYSTDVSVLEELRDKHPVVALILEHRQLDKLKGTYLDALPALINPETGRVHTSFNQAGTSTGRLSSSDPNLQNIPVRTELGRLVRAAFVAPEGAVLLGCDYSQVELRLLAHFTGDPELTNAFMRDEDVHASTAAALLGIPLEQVTKEQRGLAKTINFGILYGMSDYGLSARTDLSVTQARQFIEAYFERFGHVKAYLESTLRRATEHGHVETILGRRRYFPELQPNTHVNAGLKRAAERQAINAPIQGSAADIIKLAMIQLDRRLRESDLRARMVLQVHDELVLEVPEDEVDRATALVIETMENAYKLDVPLKVDAAVGKNWMEMK
ncbi:MAG: DNA polymerase I [Anaerolineae bacterium]